MSVIAKRYVKALDGENLEEFLEILSLLSENFSDSKFKTVLTSNLSSDSQKEEILFATSENVKVRNFFKLLVKNGRVSEIPAIAKELDFLISSQQGKFEGELLSVESINIETLNAIAEGISKKLGKEISLVSKKSEVSGVKVVIPNLHVEISISKSRVETDMINHILKAI
jgi:F-type H+-transporting ATPase subunit delta